MPGVNPMPALTDLDHELIRFISRGISAKEIAKQISRPLSFVYYRIDRLKQMGVVDSRGYSINYKNLGFNIDAVIIAKIGGTLVSPAIKYRSPVEAILAEQTPGMVAQYAGSAENRSIIIVQAAFKGIQEIDTFVKSLHTLFDVESVQKYLIAEKHPA
jgi:DNA-binding Lrp family transcriptional regulator